MYVVFRIVSSLWFSLVVLILSLLNFSFLLDLVIGRRVVHRMKVRVLVMEDDNL